MSVFEVASDYSLKCSAPWQETAQGIDPCFTVSMAALLCNSVTITDNTEQMLSVLNSKWQLYLNDTEVELFLTCF